MLSPVPGPDQRRSEQVAASPHQPADGLGRAPSSGSAAAQSRSSSIRASRSGRHAGGRRPVAGARGVAPVGGRHPGTAQVEPVVRQHDPGQAGPCPGLAAPQPGQLGDGVRRRRAPGHWPRLQAAAPSRSTRAAASGADSVSFHSLAGRTTDAGGVEHHHPVLLAGDGERRPAGAAPRSAPARPSASHHASGSCSLRGGETGGCGARAAPPAARCRRPGPPASSTASSCRPRRRAPPSHALEPGAAAQRAPSRSSVTSWSSRSWP